MRRTTRAIVCTAFILEVLGVWFSALGVVRESFIELSRQTGGFDFGQPEGRQPVGRRPGAFDPDAFDPDSFGGQKPALDRFAVNAGLALGLLPSDRELTAEHRRENARSAVLGVVLILVGMLTNGAVKARESLRDIGIAVYSSAVRAAGYARSVARKLWTNARRR